MRLHHDQDALILIHGGRGWTWLADGLRARLEKARVARSAIRGAAPLVRSSLTGGWPSAFEVLISRAHEKALTLKLNVSADRIRGLEVN